MLDADDPGLAPVLTFDPAIDIAAPYIATGARPAIAILREQGVNGQVEMAAAFDRAGFDGDRRAHDRHPRRTPVARRVPRLRRLRRLFLRRRARRRRRLGQVDPVQRAGPRRLRGVLRSRRRVRARRLQRLPDDEQPVRAHPGNRALAALRPQPVGAVRGALRAARGAAPRRRCSSAGWRGAASPSPPRTARATRNFAMPRRLDAAQPLVALRFADNRGEATERIRSTRTARRRASRGSRLPTVVTRS